LLLGDGSRNTDTRYLPAFLQPLRRGRIRRGRQPLKAAGALSELYEDPDCQSYKYANKEAIHAAAFSTRQQSTRMQGCDELPRLPEEENKSLENQSSTVVAWGICKVYAIKRIPSAKMNEG